MYTKDMIKYGLAFLVGFSAGYFAKDIIAKVKSKHEEPENEELEEPEEQPENDISIDDSDKENKVVTEVNDFLLSVKDDILKVKNNLVGNKETKQDDIQKENEEGMTSDMDDSVVDVEIIMPYEYQENPNFKTCSFRLFPDGTLVDDEDFRKIIYKPWRYLGKFYEPIVNFEITPEEQYANVDENSIDEEDVLYIRNNTENTEYEIVYDDEYNDYAEVLNDMETQEKETEEWYNEEMQNS